MYDQRLKNSKQGNWIIWTISSVAFDNDELLVEDSFDDKLAPIMLQSSLTKHLLKADILFRREFEIIPVDSGICRCRASDPLFRGCHQSGSLSGVTRERHPASQSEHLSYAEKFFGIQRCSLCEAGWRSRVTPPYNLRYDKFKKEDRTPDNNRPQGSQV